MKKPKKSSAESLKAKLDEAEAIALRFHLQAEWLAHELKKRGAKPEEEVCRHAPESGCDNCAGKVSDCWIEAAGTAVDSFMVDYLKRQMRQAQEA